MGLSKMINVTKTWLPDFNEYTSILKRAWDKGWITNNGDLVKELEASLKEYLGVKHLLFTSNGTIAIQMALKALNITKEVITTPFSYVATTNAIIWEGCTPIFVDIKSADFCINADLIEAAITENTQAILATHVYGLPCNIEKIESLAVKYNLKVIYDGAHAFGCNYKSKSLLNYGDISTCSFHATKLFHSVEGGCVITDDDELARWLFLSRQFGHLYDDYYLAGINANNSEFHAAMGLCVLPKVPSIIEARRKVVEYYDRYLNDILIRPLILSQEFVYNYAYYPVVFRSEKELLLVKKELLSENLGTRRYFYPSLNTLPYVSRTECYVSEDISKRVLCLPLFYDIAESDLDRIISIIRGVYGSANEV